MKKNFILFFVVLNLSGLGDLTGLMAQSSPRKVINFNFGWEFSREDTSVWRSLDLPHDFQFEQPWDEEVGGARGFKAMGGAWYRKHFKVDKSWTGKRILLDFEGIMYYGDVYFNGAKVGSTEYGYLGFETDVTQLINPEGDNIVTVYANTGAKEGSRWYTGGGLYRDVHLIIKNDLAVARNGVYITSNIGTHAATVNIRVEIDNLHRNKAELSVGAKIFSPDGKLAGETTLIAPKTKKPAEEIALPAVNITNPQLWDTESPNLYTAEITLTSNGDTIDKVTETFGIRTIEYSKEFGFKLNGKKVFLKGVANHHDLGAVGVAAYERSIERLFKRLKEFGFNHIRCSHNPYSKSFLDLADKYGILITDELYDKWSDNSYWGGRDKWTNLWYKHEIEWIKRDRNHPSVILWSFGNELQIREDLAGFPTHDWGVTTYRIMDVLAKRYDNTRPTTVAMHPTRAGAIGKSDPEYNTAIIPPELATVTEISSFNYRYFDYEEYLKHAPDMIIYQSEATTNELLAPFFGMNHNTTVGLAYWGAVEYWGESNGYPKKGWAYSYFNHALEPFPQAYLLKSAFCDTPLVRIGILDKAATTEEWNEQNVGTQDVSSHWNREKGKRYNILVYTNADEAELLLNGKSLGKQQNDRSNIRKRNIISWANVPYEAGKLVAIARNGGKEVARHTIETTGKAVALKMELENPGDWRADGMDLQYVKVYAVDAKGRVVPTDAGEVTFEISGAARLIAVDNGDHYSEELFAPEADGTGKRSLHDGFAMAILRSAQTAGEVKIRAVVKGLKPAEKTVILL